MGAEIAELGVWAVHGWGGGGTASRVGAVEGGGWILGTGGGGVGGGGVEGLGRRRGRGNFYCYLSSRLDLLSHTADSIEICGFVSHSSFCSELCFSKG